MLILACNKIKQYWITYFYLKKSEYSIVSVHKDKKGYFFLNKLSNRLTICPLSRSFLACLNINNESIDFLLIDVQI